MKDSVKIPKGFTIFTRDTYRIPEAFVAIWANPNRRQWWQFWIPAYRSTYIAKKSPAMAEGGAE